MNAKTSVATPTLHGKISAVVLGHLREPNYNGGSWTINPDETADEIMDVLNTALHGVRRWTFEDPDTTGDDEFVRVRDIQEALNSPDGSQTRLTDTELRNLPVGSLVCAHWADGSLPDHQVLRGGQDSGASSAGITIATDQEWAQLPTWGATFTALHIPRIPR